MVWVLSLSSSAGGQHGHLPWKVPVPVGGLAVAVGTGRQGGGPWCCAGFVGYSQDSPQWRAGSGRTNLAMAILSKHTTKDSTDGFSDENKPEERLLNGPEWCHRKFHQVTWIFCSVSRAFTSSACSSVESHPQSCWWSALCVKQEPIRLPITGRKLFFPSVIYLVSFKALSFALQKLYIFMYSKVPIVPFCFWVSA